MRSVRLIASLSAACLLLLPALAQDRPVARQLLKEAEEHCESVQNKDNRAFEFANIASAWQQIDKSRALTNLERAASTASNSSTSWREILSVWARQDSDTAFSKAIALKNADEGPARIGELLVQIALSDTTKATTLFGQVPSSVKQEVAQAAVSELSITNQDLCESFIATLPTVSTDPLYRILAKNAKDGQVAYRAAQKVQKDRSIAVANALARMAKTEPALAYSFAADIPEPELRALVLAHCAEALYRSNAEQGMQCAAQAINLYNQLPPDWSSRPKQFVRIEPHISHIDSDEVKQFLQGFTTMVENHFANGADDESTQPVWLMVAANAWAKLDLEKARVLASRALEFGPESAFSSSSDHRYFTELARLDPDDAATLLSMLKSVSAQVFRNVSHGAMLDLLPNDLIAARATAKQLGGDLANFVEIENARLKNSLDSNADALLRIESGRYTDDEFWDLAEEFTDHLIQQDPYRAVKAINLMESRSHRLPLLARVVIAISKTNVTLAQSVLDGAVEGVKRDMPAEAKVSNRVALARAAIALNI